MSSNRPKDALADYVPVAERIEKFHARYPEGRILTSIVEHDIESGFILMRAEVYRTGDDATPAATGHAYEVRGDGYVNKSSYIENAETGACGRALAILGFEVKRGLASREEMEKVGRLQNAVPRDTAPSRTASAPRTAPSETGSEAARNETARNETANAVKVDFARGVADNKSSDDEDATSAVVQARPTLASPASAATAAASIAGGRLPNLRPVEDADAPASDEQKIAILNLLESLRPRDRRAQRAMLMERTGKSSRDELTTGEAQRLIEDLRG